MLLSIVMIVKNEEKILVKMLESLKVLMDSIDSELIIIDTGSADNTINIAKNYTKNVYFHKWDDDFSSMRNKSISYSKGDWVFVLDADEILTDCTKLIEFFDSDLHKTFNSASIQLKNIYSIEKDSYGYGSVLRLFKNNGFKFIGKVHEQPLYKEPVFHNVAQFDHYGYMFEDEEVRLYKVKRNEKLLFQQLSENNENPYTNYQLGKNFIILEKYQDALFYLEKSIILYKKIGLMPGYLITNLAKVYLFLGKNKKCEKLCLKYIEKDLNNIDIYYYLAQTQVSLGKYEYALDSYKRYIYLIDNYEMSTQANSLFSDTDTVSLKDSATVTLIKIYYKLEKYDLVIKEFENIIDYEKRKDVYFSLFMSLYKLNKFSLINEYHDKLKKSAIEKNSFYNSLELFLNNIREDEKSDIYKILSSIKGVYGRFNNIRLLNQISSDECKDILKKEKNDIYAPIINIAYLNNIDLLDIFLNMDYSWIERYVRYCVMYDREFSLKLYKYILRQKNTFEIHEVKVYRVFTKIILENNILNDDKYKELFYIYIMYSSIYIKNIYANLDYTDLLTYMSNEMDKFVIKFNSIMDYKDSDKIIYLRKLKELLNEYPYYHRIIKLIIKDFEYELNQNIELNVLRVNFIDSIKQVIEKGNISDARDLIDKYLKSFREDSEILNIKGIIHIMSGEYAEADFYLKKALSLDISNGDIMYNIKYLKEVSSYEK
ncbi:MULTISPECIES: glycosyltransferase [unclassified Clostridioides]|uniref:glycosyltransferase n=1 Tax=unclassified Clostridioides TaxID=2635829 RepID=UPI001D12E104|nr:glycosyltransferase [Clostridioides sp. ES-S-0001-02]UDN58185.1 glycosyltransferase [Clostridioides sp. ES-S-0010-02]UDN62222.1 glycosyltransferase [Clostridioides sp. ES-W-0016-02]